MSILRRCLSYRESNKESKEKQGPTLGVSPLRGGLRMSLDPSLNFKTCSFTYCGGSHVALGILVFCICACLSHCHRFNPSLCPLSPFLLSYVAVSKPLMSLVEILPLQSLLIEMSIKRESTIIFNVRVLHKACVRYLQKACVRVLTQAFCNDSYTSLL